MKYMLILLSTYLLVSCAGQAPRSLEHEFIFDYKDLNGSKDEVWTKARDFFASAYGDYGTVFKSSDKDEGTFIGKAVVGWYLDASMVTCHQNYSIIFIAKDNKARLKLELLESRAASSSCGWDWPTQAGYDEIVVKFKGISKSMGKALNEQSISDF